MLRTLFGKISLAVLSIFIILTVLLVGSIDNTTMVLQQEAVQKLHQDLAKNIIKDSDFWFNGEINQQSIENAFHMMMQLGPATELYVVSPEGMLTTYSDPDNLIQRFQIDMAPVNQYLEDASQLPILGDDPRSESDRKIFSVAPVYENYDTGALVPGMSPIAYLYIIIGGDNYDSVIEMMQSSYFARIGISALITAIVFFVLVIMLLFFYLTRPIRQLSSSLLEFRASSFLKVPATLPLNDNKAHDELGQLSHVIREMADRIVVQFDEMIRNKELRQELVTHISHDLKTPLTNIKGYLESVQINSDQTNPETAQYIEIALKNCDQLEVMIGELLEFSRLESKDMQAEIETFALDELIDDITQKFQGKASTRNIKLLCESPSGLPFVKGDIAMINRVINNLIENALRHSKADSQVVVRIQAQDQHNKVSVQVIDSGSGIPEKDIEMLFEPYFRASNQDRHYIKGSGLGLAISKRLLKLHDSDITVDTRVGHGSTFAFSLQTA